MFLRSSTKYVSIILAMGILGCARHTLSVAPAQTARVRPTAYIIFFPTGSSALAPSGMQVLRSVGLLAHSDTLLRFKIVGHETHEEARSPQFKKLDAARAIEVANWLRSEGVASDRVAVSGTKDRETIDNSSRNSAVDRRVEIMPY